MLADTFQAGNSGQIPVDYTLINVHKPSGAKPGFCNI